MTLYSNMQICGVGEITVYRRDETVWVTIKDGNQTLTMEDRHVRALAIALSDFMIAEWAAAKSVAAPAPAPVTAVDAAERVTA